MATAEKIKLHSRVLLSYIKNFGNKDKVCKELDLPYDYVRKLVARFKNTIDAEVRKDAARYLALQFIENHYMRKEHVYEALALIKNDEFKEASVCCKYPIEIHKVKGKNKKYCMKCGKETRAVKMLKQDISNTKRGYLRDLSEDERNLSEIAKNLGIVATDIVPAGWASPVRETVVDASARGYRMTTEDKVAQEELKQIGAIPREDMIKKLEQKIMNKKIADKKKAVGYDPESNKEFKR
jgi:hypothetical protein